MMMSASCRPGRRRRVASSGPPAFSWFLVRWRWWRREGPDGAFSGVEGRPEARQVLADDVPILDRLSRSIALAGENTRLLHEAFGPSQAGHPRIGVQAPAIPAGPAACRPVRRSARSKTVRSAFSRLSAEPERRRVPRHSRRRREERRTAAEV